MKNYNQYSFEDRVLKMCAVIEHNARETRNELSRTRQNRSTDPLRYFRLMKSIDEELRNAFHFGKMVP